MLITPVRNGPRVLKAESRYVVDAAIAGVVSTERLVFEDEGHGVMKFKNQVVCYTPIEESFWNHLNP